MNLRRSLIFAALGAVFSLGCVSHAVAQAWPSKPIRLLIGQAAGGAADGVTRAVGDALSAALGQPVLTENRPGGGAGGILALTMTSQAPADGYTLAVGTSGPMGAGPAIANVPWDPVTGFTHISLISESPWWFLSSASLPGNTLSEVLKLLKANPGKYNYGSDGIGSTSHLGMEQLKVRERMFVVHIPYVTAASRIQGLLASDIHFMLYPPTVAIENFAKEGKLKILAVTSPARLPQYPNVPTTKEAGLPNYELSSWYSLVGPAGLPRDIQARLHKELSAALQRPDVQKRIMSAGQLVIRTTTSEELAAYVANQNRQWKEVVKSAGIKVE